MRSPWNASQAGRLAIGLTMLIAVPIDQLHAQSSKPPIVDGRPVAVAITLHINKLYNVDTVTETYLLDGYLAAKWLDPRLATQHDGQNGREVYENEAASEKIASGIWWPTIELLNSIRGREVANKRIVIDERGRVMYNERFHATLMSNMDFRKYPFDTQTFTLQIESFSYDAQEMVFVRPQAFPNALSEMPLEEWTILEKRTFVSQSQYEHLEDDAPVHFSRYNLEVRAKRKPGYFLSQFFLPLMLIIASSWVVFWISDFNQQLSISFTLMLTVVAFNFFTSTLLPRLPYNTFIETVITSGYVAIALSIVAVMILQMAIQRNHSVLARKLTALYRWGFPGGYLIFFMLLVLIVLV
jgi:hypothetical protein